MEENDMKRCDPLIDVDGRRFPSGASVVVPGAAASAVLPAARYVRVKETGGKLGFITPHTHNFCESCNRVRLTCTGQLYMCLGNEDVADLRTPLRAPEGNERLELAIRDTISRKPKGHDFVIDRRHNRAAVARHMSMTGG
jgi:cyclic pyranopterin phosphate synthase